MVPGAGGWSRQYAGQGRHGEIHRASGPQGKPIAEVLEKEERGQHRARDCPEGVGAVERRHLAPSPVGVRLHGAHDGGESAAHQEGGREQHQRGQHQAQHGAETQPERERATEGEVGLPRQPEQQRRQRRAQRDGKFEPGVIAEGVTEPVHPRAQHDTARAQPAHEDRQHGRRRRRRGAKDEPELAQPGGLVNQRTEAGSEQAKASQAAGHGSRWCRSIKGRLYHAPRTEQMQRQRPTIARRRPNLGCAAPQTHDSPRPGVPSNALAASTRPGRCVPPS